MSSRRLHSRLSLLALAFSLALLPSAAAGQRAQRSAAPPAANAWLQASSDLPADPDTRFGTLPNGMRYAIRRNATPPHNASLRLRIDAGSLAEADDQRGLAHFIEHMVMNGSTNVPEGEFVRRLERHGLRFGPDTNATTEFTQTYYKLDLPETDAATVDEALFLLREVAGEASFTPAAIDRERGIIQSEERTRATPALRMVMDQLGFFMPGQLITRRFPIGTPEVIAQAQRDRFLALYRAYYRPERATLIVVGDFDPDEMERKIRDRFSNWRGQGPAGPNPALGAVAPRQTGARIHVEAGLPNQVVMAWVRPPDLRPDNRATRAAKLDEALVVAVLNRRLERLTAQSPSPFNLARAVRSDLADSANITQLIAIVGPGAWRPGLTAIETEQRRLAEHGMTQAELSREIEQVRAVLVTNAAGAATRQTPVIADSLLRNVNEHEVFDSPAQQLSWFDAAVSGVTVARANQVARQLFAGEPLLYMTSPTPVEGGEAALLAAWRTAHAAPVAAAEARQVQPWPYTSFGTPGQVVERRELPAEIGATAIRFANGVRLTVKQTAFANDQIIVSVRMGNGVAGTPADRSNPAWALAPTFAGGGLGRISIEDMQDTLNGRTFSANLAMTEDAFRLTGQTRPADFALQMQVLAAYVTDPGWRPTGFDRVRGLTATLLGQLDATPGGVFSREDGKLLHNGERRFGLPSAADMQATRLDDVRAMVQPALSQAPIEVVVVGDVTVDEAIRQVAATFGALPARPASAPPPAGLDATRFPAGNAEPVRLTHGGRADQGLAYIGWPTTGFYADQRQARALTALADVFQLRLIQKIREEQGTTYSPGSGHNPSEIFPNYGVFFARIEARPEALAGFLRDAEGIVADLRDRPIEADEMARAMRPRLESLQRQRNDNGWWLSELAGIQTDSRVAQSITRQIADYQSLTPADLQRVARLFLLPDRDYKILVVPRDGAAPAQ